MGSDRRELYRVNEGLAAFGSDATAIIGLIEALFSKLAVELGAEAMTPPPLVRIEDLNRIDYFQNFPHLGTWVAPLRAELFESYTDGRQVNGIGSQDLEDSRYGLPSATCFNVYIDLKGAALERTRRITLASTCFRREDAYRDLSRLWAFRMAEVVCVGASDEVQAFLRDGKQAVADLIARVDLPVRVETAQDPFFSKDNPRLAMQKLFPTKEEFQYGEDALAIASVNFHHNFFGERFEISGPDGKHAYTGCVAIGIERWVKALLDRYGDDPARIRSHLSDCLDG